MHEILVNRLGGLSLPRKSVVRLTDRPDITLDVYRGRKTTNENEMTMFNISLLRSPNKNVFLCYFWNFLVIVLDDRLVGCFGFNGPLRQYFSLYQAVCQREGER